jgi:hypothetical protein
MSVRLLRRLEHAETIIAIQKSRSLAESPAGDRQRRRIMIDAVVALAPTPGLTASACMALNVSRASVYRQRERLAMPRAVPRAAPSLPSNAKSCWTFCTRRASPIRRPPRSMLFDACCRSLACAGHSTHGKWQGVLFDSAHDGATHVFPSK